MLINDSVWSDEWFCSLPQRLKLLYLYLLGASSKCGIFELNMRKINFDLTNGVEDVAPYTAKEILTFGGDRIKKIDETKAIIVGYLAYNWMRDKPLDPIHNPLHRGLAQELAKYGLTFAKVNAMSKKKLLRWVGEENEGNKDGSDTGTTGDRVVVGVVRQLVKPKSELPETSVTAKDAEELFDAWWKEYPSCSRKVNKKVCHDKFVRILKNSNDGVSTFNQIMDGLKKWIASKDWNKDGGQFICAPLVWLNQERWTADVEADPTKHFIPKKPIVVKDTDWTLCRERCANCGANGCKCGAKLPPMMWERPTAPEECSKYKSL